MAAAKKGQPAEPRATIAELVEKRRELVAQLAEVDAEIRSRHGEQTN